MSPLRPEGKSAPVGDLVIAPHGAVEGNQDVAMPLGVPKNGASLGLAIITAVLSRGKVYVAEVSRRLLSSRIPRVPLRLLLAEISSVSRRHPVSITRGRSWCPIRLIVNCEFRDTKQKRLEMGDVLCHGRKKLVNFRGEEK